jgi:hypothetical protein
VNGGKFEPLNAKMHQETEGAVLDIHFAYNNHQLIKLLQKRGKYITNLDFSGVDLMDAKIQKLV